MAAPRRRDLIEILDDHERQIRRLSQTIARSGNVDLSAYLPLAGGTMTGSILVDDGTNFTPMKWEREIAAVENKGEVGLANTGMILRNLNNVDTELSRFALSKSSTEQSTLDTTLKIVNPVAFGGTDDAQIRLTKTGDGNSVLLRNDGTNFFFLSTDTEDGTWNSNRPFSFDLTNGYVTLGQIVGDILMRNNRMHFNYQTETTSYIEHDTGSNIFRFFNANNEMMRMGEGILSIYGASWGQLSNLQAGAMYMTNEIANVDLYLRTDNGGGAKNRMFIDGSANTINFYNHDGTVIGGWATNRLNVANNGAANAPAYDIANTGTGMFRTTTSGGRLNLTVADTARLLITATPTLAPAADNNMSNGAGTLRWVDVWAVDTSINSSDEREKKYIKELDSKMVSKLIDLIEPIKFVRKGRNRTHWGFGAFQVKDSLTKAGLDPKKYAVWIDPMVNPHPEDVTEGITEDTAKAIRAGELLPIAWQEIRSLRERVAQLEAKEAK